MQPDTQGNVQYATEPARPSMAFALKALILGILGLILCLGAPLAALAVVVAALARRRVLRDPVHFRGDNIALLAMVLGILGLIGSAYTTRESVRWKRRIGAIENLHYLIPALNIFASEHNGNFPPDLQTLVAIGYATPDMLVVPGLDHTQSACHWSYVAGIALTDPVSWIVAYGDPQYFWGKGAPILYVNHVEFVDEPVFSSELRRFEADCQRARGQPPTIVPPR